MLNTLFHIKYMIRDKEYARAAPVVKHPYLYQESFEYPSYEGHFRRYDVTEETKEAAWDTAEGTHIKEPKTRNSDTDARKIYTSVESNGTWSKMDFDAMNVANLRVSLDISPSDGDDTEETTAINRVRGRIWDDETSSWRVSSNRLGGVMYSAPAIVNSNSRTGSRTEVAYFGDVYGMVHAVDTATGNEKWAYIPRNLLGKLKNDRTDPDADQDFAAVNGSPAAKDIYYDHDGDASTPKAWRTVLIFGEGWGNNYIFALDVTDPDNWSVVWELEAETGVNPNGSEVVTVGGTDYVKPIPLFNAGGGYPISVSPAVVRINPVIVIFGTGGTDWADDDNTYSIFAVNATNKRATPSYYLGAGTLYWEKTLATGEKVYSTPTVAGDLVYVANATGDMDSDNPSDDLSGEGEVHAINLRSGTEAWAMDHVGKARGSLYVDREHIYLTTNRNEVVQIGNDDFSAGGASNVKLRTWKQLN